MRIEVNIDDQTYRDKSDDTPRRATFPLIPADSRSVVSAAEAQQAISAAEAEDDADRAGSG